MISQNRVLAIIVTFNRLDLLKGAIGSLQGQTFPCDILVINNGSTDGTESYLSSLTDLQVINQENIGGAGGFHTGLKYAAEHGYEFGWVMDDDVIALPDCLFQLISQYDRLSDAGEKIGFLCSKVENVDGLTVNVPFVSNRLNATGYAFWNQHLADGLVGLESATFVSVLIPCERVWEMGLPYKTFFIWGDDTEYTMRLSRDFLCYQVGRSRIKHLRVGGILSIYTMQGTDRIRMFRYFVRNHLFMARKGYKHGTIRELKNNAVIILKLLVKGEIRKAWTVTIGMAQGLFFNPSIDYPKTALNDREQDTHFCNHYDA